MKIKEVKSLDAKELAEKLENAKAALDTMKLNHQISHRLRLLVVTSHV